LDNTQLLYKVNFLRMV